jgi:hypothetical protein
VSSDKYGRVDQAVPLETSSLKVVINFVVKNEGFAGVKFTIVPVTADLSGDIAIVIDKASSNEAIATPISDIRKLLDQIEPGRRGELRSGKARVAKPFLQDVKPYHAGR